MLLAGAMSGEEDEHVLDEEAARDRRREAANEGGGRIGLNIDQSDTAETMAFSSVKGTMRTRPFRLVIENPNLFLGALRLLRREMVESRALSARQLEVLVGALREQLITHYMSAKSGEMEPSEFLRFVSAAENIHNRLGELANLTQLDEVGRMLESANLRRLGEYLKLRDTQCFDTPTEKTFGPGQWHIDATVDFYRRKWAVCLAAVTESAMNPHAATLVLAAAENLLECIQHVRGEIAKRKEGQAGDEYRQQFLQIFNQYSRPHTTHLKLYGKA